MVLAAGWAAEPCLEGLPVPHDAICTAVCAKGWVPSESFLACSFEEYSPPNFTCSEAPCPALSNDPWKGVLNARTPTCKEGPLLNHSNLCTTECQPGYGPSIPSLQCLYGEFHPPAFECWASPCDMPVDIEHALSPPCAEGVRLPEGAMCTAKCAQGYKPHPPLLSCRLGEMVPMNFTCSPAQCAAPSGVANAIPKPDALCYEGFTIEHETNCTTRCANGYYPSDELLSCEFGVLTPSTFVCLPLPCEVPNGISNSLEQPCEEGSLPHGGSCTAQCYPGYIASVARLDCNLGQLTPSTFECLSAMTALASPCTSPTNVANHATIGCIQDALFQTLAMGTEDNFSHVVLNISNATAVVKRLSTGSAATFGNRHIVMVPGYGVQITVPEVVVAQLGGNVVLIAVVFGQETYKDPSNSNLATTPVGIRLVASPNPPLAAQPRTLRLLSATLYQKVDIDFGGRPGSLDRPLQCSFWNHSAGSWGLLQQRRPTRTLNKTLGCATEYANGTYVVVAPEPAIVRIKEGGNTLLVVLVVVVAVLVCAVSVKAWFCYAQRRKKSRVSAVEEVGLPDKAASELYGVSLSYLLEHFEGDAKHATGQEDPDFNLIAEHLFYGQRGRGQRDRCPRDGLQGCSFVDTLPKIWKQQATHVLSWTWSYKLSLFISALRLWQEKEELEPEDTFLWICAFCNNNYRIFEEKTKHGSEDLEKRFEERLRRTGHMVAMLDSWHRPVYLTRLWALYEQYTAQFLDIKITFILPPKHDETFSTNIKKDTKKIVDGLKIIDSQNAQASSFVDQMRLMQEIRGAIGFDRVNQKVKDNLMKWLKDKAFEQLMERGGEGGPRAAAKVENGRWVWQRAMLPDFD